MEKGCEKCRNLRRLEDGSWVCSKGCIEINIFSNTECPSWEPKEAKTYNYKGKIYIQLRPITIKSLILDKANDGDIEYLNRNYHIIDEIGFTYAIEFCSDCLDKMKWMEEKGYWKVEEEKFECRRGDKYSVNGREYILVYCGKGVGALLVNLKTGGFWANPVPVRSLKNITKEEFKNILGPVKDRLVEIYATRIPCAGE